MGNVITRVLTSGSARLSYNAIFTMTVGGEEVSILKPSDLTPEQVNALDAQGYEKLLIETRTRKLEELQQITMSKKHELTAREFEERNTEEAKAAREQKKQELAALAEERKRVYEELGPISIEEFINAVPREDAPSGQSRWEKTMQEMKAEEELRARYGAERRAVNKAAAEAKAHIEAAHRV